MNFYSRFRWVLTALFGLLLLLAFVASTGNDSPTKSTTQKTQQKVQPSGGAKFY